MAGHCHCTGRQSGLGLRTSREGDRASGHVGGGDLSGSGILWWRRSTRWTHRRGSRVSGMRALCAASLAGRDGYRGCRRGSDNLGAHRSSNRANAGSRVDRRRVGDCGLILRRNRRIASRIPSRQIRLGRSRRGARSGGVEACSVRRCGVGIPSGRLVDGRLTRRCRVAVASRLVG